MKIEDLQKLSISEQLIIYAALVSHIKSGSGYGFRNEDRGHIAYHSEPSKDSETELGDGPNTNTLYRAMKSLVITANEYMDFPSDDIVTDWASFCALVRRYEKPNHRG